MLLKTVFMFSLLISIAGCSIEEAKENADQNQQKTVVPAVIKKPLKPFKKSAVTYKVVPLEEPNSYAIEVSWEQTDYFVFLRHDTNVDFVKISPDKQSHRIIVKGVAKENIEIEARESESASVSEYLKLEVPVPRDWVINKTYELTGNQIQKCGRLFFTRSGVLEIKNFNIEVQCEELISDNGVIRTFPSNAIANGKGANGRSGGIAKLFFKVATGHVSVFLNGENGTDGKNGYKGFPIRRGVYMGCKGQAGGRGGGTGSSYIFVDQASQLKVRTFITSGHGGKGGQMIAELNDKTAIQPGELCIESGGSGADGASGDVGESCVQVSNGQPICERKAMITMNPIGIFNGH